MNPRLAILVLGIWPLVATCGKEGSAHRPDAAAPDAPGGTSGEARDAGSGGSADARPSGNGGDDGRAGGGAMAGRGSGGWVNGTGGAVNATGGAVNATGGAVNATGGQGGSSYGGGGALAACGRCEIYGTPSESGKVGVTELNALSGLAVSRTQPDVLFAHNDHDRAVVYALDRQGREHAQITLANASASDIEDIALGPCGGATCIYLGDIGDNSAQRSEYAVLRFAEPAVPAAPGNVSLTAAFERLRFTYEDGSHNAEGLMVAPDGTIYVVTKLAPGSGGRVAATGPSSVYKLPATLTTATVAKATKVATLPVPAGADLAASAAAAHPCGLGFLLRTYDKVYEFSATAGMGFESAFRATPKVVATPNEPQSEGIDYEADGHGFISSGEGANAPIMRTGCAP